MLNSITLHGRLTKDVELRHTQNQTPVASFTLAVDRSYTQGGERQTDFINCVAWRNTAEFADKWFRKGSQTVVHGSLQMRNYTDRDGNNRTAAEVVVDSMDFCDKREEQSTPAARPVFVEMGDDGDLPF